MRHLSLPFMVIVYLLLFLLFSSCQRSLLRVYIEVDHGTRTLETNAQTVRELLAEAEITLGELDRVKPDLNFSVRPEMTVQVIRVRETFETKTNLLPFARRVVVNEALAPDEQRLAQLGVDGLEETVTRITYEDDVEVGRAQVSKSIIREPVEEILIVGAKPDGNVVTFPGHIFYLSGGNAWLMKENSAARRSLSMSGDLDGRVFALSPDGNTLMVTRAVSQAIDGPLNEVWLVDTRIVDEPPRPTSLQGVLYAAWSPTLTDTIIAYSTANRVPSQPGWHANNDLWLWDITQPISAAIEILPPNSSSLYAWWGTNFAWAPDGSQFAYATANEIGIIDVLSKTVKVLLEFAPYETRSNWVWVPQVTWSPDSRLVAAVGHGPPLQDERAEESPIFDLWLLSADGKLRIKVQEQTGMWSNPIWHQQGILFGQAINPLNSVNSHYKLRIIDWDGSNAETVFPLGEEAGVNLPEMLWNPNPGGASFLFVQRQNLYLHRLNGLPPQPLTSDNQSRLPQWITPFNTPTSITATTTVLPALSITPTLTLTVNTIISTSGSNTP